MWKIKLRIVPYATTVPVWYSGRVGVVSLRLRLDPHATLPLLQLCPPFDATTRWRWWLSIAILAAVSNAGFSFLGRPDTTETFVEWFHNQWCVATRSIAWKCCWCPSVANCRPAGSSWSPRCSPPTISPLYTTQSVSKKESSQEIKKKRVKRETNRAKNKVNKTMSKTIIVKNNNGQ